MNRDCLNLPLAYFSFLPGRGNWDSDFGPKTRHSQGRRHKIFDRAVKDGLWPGQAKAEFKLAAVNQSSKAGWLEKF